MSDTNLVGQTSNCAPRFIKVDDAMSLTRADITGWNRADIDSLEYKEVGLDKIIAQTKEARVAGAQQRSLTDLLLSRHAPLKKGGGGPNNSVIQPFRFVPRRARVNPQYFRISAGAQSDKDTHYNADDGSKPAANIDGHWAIKVNNGSLDGADSSPFVKNPNNALKGIHAFFLRGHYLTIEWKAADGTAKTAVVQVASVKAIDDDQCWVVIAPNKTYNAASAANVALYRGAALSANGWWEAASAGEKANYQPTIGVVKIQANSVSNYESYGHALPGYNDLGLVEYWQQTMRWVHKYNDAYVEALEAAHTSDGFKKFRLLPLAKLRAIQEKFQEDFFYETAFYGDAISEKQTTTDWQNLPKVYDPAWAASGETGSLHLEFNSNTLGVRTQLAACGMVLDKQGGVLDVDDMLEMAYWVRRERQGEVSNNVTDIDIMTDLRWTRATLRTLFAKYFKAKYAIDNVSAFMQVGQKIQDAGNGRVMWEYDSYELPDQGVRLNVISDEYFDDRISHFQPDQKSRGRGIWMLDWSDIAINVMKSMSVPRTNNQADDLYKYVMTPNVQHVLMNSKTFEVQVGNTNRHRLIENFSDGPPKLTVPGVDINQ
jgi:hypothetical protein